MRYDINQLVENLNLINTNIEEEQLNIYNKENKTNPDNICLFCKMPVNEEDGFIKVNKYSSIGFCFRCFKFHSFGGVMKYDICLPS